MGGVRKAGQGEPHQAFRVPGSGPPPPAHVLPLYYLSFLGSRSYKQGLPLPRGPWSQVTVLVGPGHLQRASPGTEGLGSMGGGLAPSPSPVPPTAHNHPLLRSSVSRTPQRCPLMRVSHLLPSIPSASQLSSPKVWQNAWPLWAPCPSCAHTSLGSCTGTALSPQAHCHLSGRMCLLCPTLTFL